MEIEHECAVMHDASTRNMRVGKDEATACVLLRVAAQAGDHVTPVTDVHE